MRQPKRIDGRTGKMTETAADTLGHATAKVIIGAVRRETAHGERRVAITPETAKKLVAARPLGRIETRAGDGEQCAGRRL